MKKITQSQILYLGIAAAAMTTTVVAFVPSSSSSSSMPLVRDHRVSNSVHSSPRRPFLVSHDRSSSQRTGSSSSSSTSLQMAAEDFNESKYTEAAWSSIAALTKVADYYRASTVEAPLLLDVMLNPSKHSAGENAQAAQKVVEKALAKAGVDVQELRMELEKYLGKQARVTDNSQKVMGRTLQKVLDTARVGQSVLGVRSYYG